MKKVALLLSGHIREKNQFKNIVNFIKENPKVKIHIYMHIHDLTTYKTHKDNNDSKWFPIDKDEIISNFNPVCISYEDTSKQKTWIDNLWDKELKIIYEEIYNKLNKTSEKPKMYKKKDLKPLKYWYHSDNYERHKRTFLQAHMWHKCWNLFENECKKNNLKYDLIIRTRYDVKFNNKINLISILNQIKNKTILTTKVGKKWNALAYFGTSDAIKISCSIGDLKNYKKFILDNKDDNLKTLTYPESCYAFWCIKNKIQFETINKTKYDDISLDRKTSWENMNEKIKWGTKFIKPMFY